MAIDLALPTRDSHRDGSTYDDTEDRARLNRQCRTVWDLMRDGKWRTLHQIQQATGEPQTSISARLRDCRKPRFGSHVVDRRRLEGGVYQYRVAPRAGSSK